MTTMKTADDREIRPPANIQEHPEGARLTLEMPGVREGTLSVTVDDDVLSVEGERIDSLSGQEALHRETRTGNYVRKFRLSRDLSREGIAAEYRNGLVTVTIPRAEHTRPRKIEIETS